MSWEMELDDQLLQDMYTWIDQIPLSRPKRRIERDFSDGVMVAELVKYYFPNWVELHNYTPTNNTQQKMINWGLLNRKVFIKFGLNVPENVMRGICIGKPGLVEIFLYNLRTKIDDYLYGMETNPTDPEYRQLFRKEKDKEKQTPRAGDANKKPTSYDDYYENMDPIQNYATTKPSLAPAAPKNYDTSRNVGNGTKAVIPAVTKKISLTNEVVSRLEYEEKEQECLAKDEQVQILNAKIRRLEHLLHLKDVRIQELQETKSSSRPLAKK